MTEFAVVEFVEDHDVAVVPINWVLEGRLECWWPKDARSQDLSKMVLRKQKVDEATWTKFDIAYHASYTNYGSANRNAKKFLNGEDIDSTTAAEDRGRGGRPRKRPKDVKSKGTPDSDCGPQSTDSDTSGEEPVAAKPNDKRRTTTKSVFRPSVAKKSTPAGLPAVPTGFPNGLSHRDSRGATPLPIPTRLFSPSKDDGQQQQCRSEVTPTSRRTSCDSVATNSSRGQLHAGHSNMRNSVPVQRVSDIDGGHALVSLPWLEAQKQSLEAIKLSLELVKANQREHTSTLAALLRQSAPPPLQLSNMQQQFGFPMKTIDEMNGLEAELVRDQDVRSRLTLLYAAVGGSFSSWVGRSLRKTMSYSLGSKYCYEGRTDGKLAFKSLLLCDILIDAIRTKSTMDEDHIEKKIKTWLRHCPARYKKEKEGAQNDENST